MRRALAWLGIVGMAVVVSGASCSHQNPETFCQGWVASTCQAIAGCCEAGTSFDVDQCHLSLSQTCQAALAVEQVQDGDRAFDSGAAGTCFGNVASCTDLATTTADTSFAHVAACSDMITGIRPAGATCSVVSDCARLGGASVCYSSGGAAGSGVCAALVLDSQTCSFSFATNQLHVCPDGSFCDRASFKPDPTAPPEKQQYEFSASCKPDLAAGADCSGAQVAPCAKGLFCGVTGTKATCTPLKSKGATCQGTQQCATGLTCTSGAGGTGQTCEPAGSFCFTPIKCGDGICQASESPQTCPKDCAAPGFCGDGTCQANENPNTCPKDCGGGGSCGDGVCQANEDPNTCPTDCFCGDGLCQPPEDATTCPQDCP